MRPATNSSPTAGLPCFKLTNATIEFIGEAIPIEFRPNLRARGSEVHASTFLHRRLIILDSALLRNRPERERILAHEIFHFVWWKAPAIRAAYADRIHQEFASGIKGEMGWSAEWRKLELKPADLKHHTRRFRDYLCESFCDSSACLLLRISRHPEITLPARARRARRNFFEAYVAGRRLKI